MIGHDSTAISPVVGSMSSVMVPSRRPSGTRVGRRGDGDGEGNGIGSAGSGSTPPGGSGSACGGASFDGGGVGSLGPVPLMKYSVRFSVSPGAVGAPVFGLISICSIPAGMSQSPSHSGCSASATCMKSDQIGNAEFAPVKPSCEPSSKPTQTAHTRFGVYPANQQI